MHENRSSTNYSIFPRVKWSTRHSPAARVRAVITWWQWRHSKCGLTTSLTAWLSVRV